MELFELYPNSNKVREYCIYIEAHKEKISKSKDHSLRKAAIMNDESSNRSHRGNDEMPVVDVTNITEGNDHDDYEMMSDVNSANDDNIHIDPGTNETMNDKSHQETIHENDDNKSGAQSYEVHDSLQPEQDNTNEHSDDALRKIDPKRFKELSKQLITLIENLQSVRMNE